MSGAQQLSATDQARRMPPAIQCRRIGPWRELLRLPDGRTLLLRPIDARDAEPLRGGFSTLSASEVRARFLRPMREMTSQMARELTELDTAKSFALAAAEPMPPGEGLVGAVGRTIIDDDRHSAEFALLVGRPLAGQGLGTLLLQRIIEWCQRRGLRSVHGEVLADNAPMLRIADKLGFQRSHRYGDGGLIQVRLDL